MSKRGARGVCEPPTDCAAPKECVWFVCSIGAWEGKEGWADAMATPDRMLFFVW